MYFLDFSASSCTQTSLQAVTGPHMCVCVCVCVFVYVCMFGYACLCMRVCVLCVYVCLFVYVCMYVSVYACVYVCVYACLCMCWGTHVYFLDFSASSCTQTSRQAVTR